MNHLDIAPQLASLVLAFYNMGGQVMGWCVPWVIGELTPYPGGESREQIEDAGGAPSAEWLLRLRAEWRHTFLLGGVCNLLGAAAFIALASDQVQPWAKRHDRRRSTSSSSGVELEDSSSAPHKS